MDIADAVTTEYVDVNPGTRVGKLRGIFDGDQTLDGIVVRGEGKFDGLVTRKELVSSHHDPEQKAGSVVRQPPKVDRDEDVRETARLMVENEFKLLPVFDEGRFVGVVTADDLLAAVHDNLGALDVADVYTQDVVSVEPETAIGEVVNVVRTHKFTRVPVVDGTDAVGMISLYDLVAFTTRKLEQEQGGNANNAQDSFGGGVSKSQGRTHGGWGERSGSQARLLDLPARDVMNSPCTTVTPDAGLDEALTEMNEQGYSSLVVVPDEFESASGIVTTTDLLRALTWTDDEKVADVQVMGVDLLDDLSRETIADRIDEIDHKYEKMDVLEANVMFHKHKERHRGTPLVQCTVRLFTTEGLFSGTGEEYGARGAFRTAAEIAESNALDDKERGSPRNQMKNERERKRTANLVEWWTTTET